MDETINEDNIEEAEVAPTAEDTQEDEVDTTEEVSSSPDDSSDKEDDLILGKFKSQEDLVNSYKELESYSGRLSQSLKDPQFIYDQAKQLGLTEEEAQAAAAGEAPQYQQPQVDINQLVDQRLQTAKDYDKALTILPELAKDRQLETWARGLVNGGMSHAKAAQTIKDRLAQTSSEAKVAGAKSKEQEISAKEQAQTSPSIGTVERDELSLINEQLSQATNDSDRNRLLMEKIKLGLK